MSRFLIVLLVIIPFVAQLIALPLVNHMHPVIMGFPLFHFWLLIWMILTPLCTWGIYRIQKQQGGIQ
ncbi:DUF3311 domain-containing protein [Fodinisporobacter ferrooxydans]|uniref:DUF3311 domain-containing protein n=1 Tax=Fodinisporobacter ferrooxydans TaxID=2901836 RepID=A0ABY4CEX3_9BACL|nr:DUF3311 domain-containing protein [Alicyclobacillaceae bacterium MYW30-H2]